MQTDDEQSMLEAFHFVRDVFLNVNKLLLSCDALLKPHGYLPWEGAWEPFVSNPDFEEPEGWLPASAVRQYYPRHEKGKSMLTVGTLFWNPEGDPFPRPLAVASLVRVKSTPSDMYWIPLLQGWHHNAKTDGTVQELENDRDDLRSTYEEVLAASRIITVARPLLELTSASQVDERLLRPLLRHLHPERPW